MIFAGADPTIITIIARLAENGSEWAKEFMAEYTKVQKGEIAAYTWVDPYEGEQEIRYEPD